MNKIGIDISPIQYKGTGVARYTDELVHNILMQDFKREYVLFYNSYGNSLKETKLYTTVRHYRNVHFIEWRLPEALLNILWNTFNFLPIERFIGNVDLFFYSDWFTPPTRAVKVTTVHDLVFLKYPETVDPYIASTQKRRFRFLQQHDFYIITDSHATRNDVLAHFSFNPDRIFVSYPGVATSPQPSTVRTQVLKKYQLHSKKFILTVGKREPRKNFPRLIEAFRQLNNQSVELVIVGVQGWQELQGQKRVRLIGYVSDEELFALYQEALCFIYPSLYEGFGFPLVEAMSLGCPTAAADTSSLKEIGEGASLLFNPNSTEDIAHSLQTLIQSTSLRKTLITQGKKRAQRFTWKKTAQQVLSVFDKALA